MKWLFGIIVIAAAVVGLWWIGWLGNLQSFFAVSPVPAPAPQATTTPQAAAPLGGMSANNDASDQALVQDTVAVDTQLQAYSADSASVDQSLQDKLVTQSY